MLDMKTAVIIKEAIDKRFAPRMSPVNLENVCRMQPIPVNTQDDGHTILGIQSGDLTILVWIQIDEISGINVRDVKAMSW